MAQPFRQVEIILCVDTQTLNSPEPGRGRGRQRVDGGNGSFLGNLPDAVARRFGDVQVALRVEYESSRRWELRCGRRATVALERRSCSTPSEGRYPSVASYPVDPACAGIGQIEIPGSVLRH